MTTLTNINWTSDTLNVISAKQELAKFLQEQTELKGQSQKIDAYHVRRISELTNLIQGN
jgi:hypothetical protein